MRTHTPVELKHPDCQLNTEPFFQCCCTCVYLKPVHYHCCSEPKPTIEERRTFGAPDEGNCVCGVQKKEIGGKELNWACACPEMGVIHDNWGPHSCGCELHTTKEDIEKWDKRKEADRKELEAFRAAAKVL